MAYRISQPLAATQFPDEDKPKKKSKRRQVKNISQKNGPIRKRITTKGGREKTITTSRDGTKRTVEKVNRKGRVKSKTVDIDVAKGKATTTKRKGGRVVSKKTFKELTPIQERQYSMPPGGDLKSLAKRNVKRAERVNDQDTDNKARKKARKKEERENRRYSPNKARRQANKQNRKNNKSRKFKTVKEIRADIKDRCKGKKKGTFKCKGGKRAI